MLKYELIILLTVLTCISCEKNGDDDIPGEPIPIDLTVTQQQLVDSDNSFSFDIFKLVTSENPDEENIMISPLSISYALSMTLNGASGVTRDSIMKTLHYNNMDIEDINNSYKDLTDKLMNVDERVIMEIANSIWIEERLRVKQAFIENLRDYFDAEAHDFSVSDPDIVEVINSWIETNTHGKIKDMLDSMPDDAAMLLINAIYFNGKWKYRFDRDNTSEMPFYRENGSEITAMMMNQELDAKVNIRESFILLELPYGQGNYVMDIILPSNGYITSDIASILDNDKWNGWIEGMTETGINLYMPRFKYEFMIELKDILSAMGMEIAFSPFAADFSNISEQSIFISKILHKTFIETKEEGTEAAAATTVMMNFTSTGPGTPLTIKLDKPFLYLIRETSTNTIVFMGKTGNPSSD